MADYVSLYTGAQIDKSIASGSSTSGFVSGSLEGTGSFGRLQVVGDTNLVGDITVGGNLTLGDADTDSVSITADLTSNLIPNATNTYDLGSAAKAWRSGSLGRLSLSDSGSALDIQGHLTSSLLSTGSFGDIKSTTLGGTLLTAAQTNITSVGALAAGSIATGFGNITAATGSLANLTLHDSGSALNVVGHITG